jgi:hypothetical protein
VRLQHEAIERLAARLREARESEADASRPFPTPEWTAVAAMVALATKRAAAGESPDSAELEALCAQL